MKKQTLILAACFLGIAASAQITTSTNDVVTNALPTLTSTNMVDGTKYDLTLGADGTTIKGNTEGGFDVSISADPFKSLPSLWIGAEQSLYWEPKLAGATDVDADWVFNAYKQIYVNPGWAAGNVYGDGGNFWRTPEIQVQYYTSDDAYIYAGVNYDFVTEGDDGFRYSAGIGIEF